VVESAKRPAPAVLDGLTKHLLALLYAAKTPEDLKRFTDGLSRFEFLNRLVDDRSFAEDAVSQSIRAVLDSFFAYGKVGRSPQELYDTLDQAGREVFSEIVLMSELGQYPDLEKEIIFCLYRIEKELISRELAKLEAGLRQAEAKKDAARAEHLFGEVKKLSEQKSRAQPTSLS